MIPLLCRLAAGCDTLPCELGIARTWDDAPRYSEGSALLCLAGATSSAAMVVKEVILMDGGPRDKHRMCLLSLGPAGTAKLPYPCPGTGYRRRTSTGAIDICIELGEGLWLSVGHPALFIKSIVEYAGYVARNRRDWNAAWNSYLPPSSSGDLCATTRPRDPAARYYSNHLAKYPMPLWRTSNSKRRVTTMQTAWPGLRRRLFLAESPWSSQGALARRVDQGHAIRHRLGAVVE